MTDEILENQKAEYKEKREQLLEKVEDLPSDVVEEIESLLTQCHKASFHWGVRSVIGNQGGDIDEPNS